MGSINRGMYFLQALSQPGGAFVPRWWVQKAFSLSWIIQWEHPVDGAMGFETRDRHLTQRGSAESWTSGGLCCGSCHVTWPPRSIPSLPPCFAAPLVPKWGRMKNAKTHSPALGSCFQQKRSALQHSRSFACCQTINFTLFLLATSENHSGWGVQ